MQWEIVVGLEVHAQLSTRSKIFSGASTEFGAAPNAEACAGSEAFSLDDRVSSVQWNRAERESCRGQLSLQPIAGRRLL